MVRNLMKIRGRGLLIIQEKVPFSLKLNYDVKIYNEAKLTI
jgi:hypothetical protein